MLTPAYQVGTRRGTDKNDDLHRREFTFFAHVLAEPFADQALLLGCVALHTSGTLRTERMESIPQNNMAFPIRVLIEFPFANLFHLHKKT